MSNKTEDITSEVKRYHNTVIIYFIHMSVICSKSLSDNNFKKQAIQKKYILKNCLFVYITPKIIKICKKLLFTEHFKLL